LSYGKGPPRVSERSIRWVHGGRPGPLPKAQMPWERSADHEGRIVFPLYLGGNGAVVGAEFLLHIKVHRFPGPTKEIFPRKPWVLSGGSHADFFPVDLSALSFWARKTKPDPFRKCFAGSLTREGTPFNGFINQQGRI